MNNTNDKHGIELSPRMKRELMASIEASDLYLEYQCNGFTHHIKTTSDEIKRILNDFSLTFISDAPPYTAFKKETAPMELAKYLVNQAFIEKIQMHTLYGSSSLLKDDSHFKQMFDTAKTEIIHYLKDERTDFPKIDLQRLFYFTDSDIDLQRQVKTAQQIVMECYSYCYSIQKKIDLEKGVADALL